MPLLFEPSLAAAQSRLAAVHPGDYARSRNFLNGAVTRLSPYLTHGFLSLRQVYTTLDARQPLDAQHKLVFELGWRAYFQHVWTHLGSDIHQSLHAGILPEAAYSRVMPTDVRQARTGIAAIDMAVRELYATGYLHNHARMWLASYLVHVRKVHWHTGGAWMLGHLIDGDVASNFLSWQWVAGTGSSKPYLFNAENVARFAPPAWHSPGTVLEASYETMDKLAHSSRSTISKLDSQRAGPGVEEPVCRNQPSLLPGSGWCAVTEAPTAAIAGRDVWLLHPWSIHPGADVVPEQALKIGIAFDSCHKDMPWSDSRWAFVTQALAAQTTPGQSLWWGNPASVAAALQSARSVRWQTDLHMAPLLTQLRSGLQNSTASGGLTCLPAHTPTPLFEAVTPHCRSFSKWWNLTRLVQ